MKAMIAMMVLVAVSAMAADTKDILESMRAYEYRQQDKIKITSSEIKGNETRAVVEDSVVVVLKGQHILRRGQTLETYRDEKDVLRVVIDGGETELTVKSLALIK